MQRRLAWPLRKDDTHKSGSVSCFLFHLAQSRFLYAMLCNESMGAVVSLALLAEHPPSKRRSWVRIPQEAVCSCAQSFDDDNGFCCIFFKFPWPGQGVGLLIQKIVGSSQLGMFLLCALKDIFACVGKQIWKLNQDSLAEWSKVLASGASPQGRGPQGSGKRIMAHIV